MQLKHIANDAPPAALPRPHEALTDPDGLLAAGGNLSLPWLQRAYQQASFPWYPADSAILWWSPGQRAVFTREGFQQRRSLCKIQRRCGYRIAIDQHFETVMRHCRETHRAGGVWIHDEMIRAYTAAFAAGFAHSVEVHQAGQLAGGVYGVRVGRVFFAESMFYLKPNASKVALMALVDGALDPAIAVIDAQFMNPHLASLGAVLWGREALLAAVASP